ncbi:DNA annealing helicase and endonuclease ZRANB3-like isoform X2 [Argopecten irradians]
MGLGKTLQAISVAYYYKKEWPLLIIVPSSLKFVWVEEIEKWLPDVQPEDIYLIQTGNDASGFAEAKISITTFGLLCKSTSKVLHEALTNQKFQVVIVDESHSIRNTKTASCKAIVPLVKAAERRILLSGTPSLAKPVELFPQIDAICPGKFGTWWNYTAKYCDAKTEMFGRVRRRCVDGASNLEDLAKRLSNMLMIRRLKNDVLTQLPPKQRQRVLFQLKDSEIKTEIKKTFEELKPLLNKGKNKIDMMDIMQQERREDHSTNALIQRLYRLSGEAKIGPAREYIEMLCENENLKFLVFAYHHSMMNGLQQSLYNKNVKFIRIDGETPTSDRQAYVQQFQSDPDVKVAILSILAAGVGLTFTAASLVVFAEMYWTPGLMIQCEDRAHRIGQKFCVSIHYLVAKETMDEWVWSAVCRKTIVTTTTLNGKRQELNADKGNRYQIEVLSNAEAVVPNKDVDLSGMFVSQQRKDQMSILDFMTSSKKRKVTGQDRKHKRLKTDNGVKCDVIDLIEDDISVMNSDESVDELSVIEDEESMAKEDQVEVEVDDLLDEDDNISGGCLNDISLNHPGKRCEKRKNFVEIDDESFVDNSSNDEDLSDDCLGDISLNHRPGKHKTSFLKTNTIKEDVTDGKTPSKSSQKRGKSLTNAKSQKLANVCLDFMDEDDDFVATPGKTLNTTRKTIVERRAASTSKKTKMEKSKPYIKLRRKLSLCQTDTDLISASHEDNDVMWSCSVCTFLNHVDLPYCEMCNKAKPSVTNCQSRVRKDTIVGLSSQTNFNMFQSSCSSQEQNMKSSENVDSCRSQNMKMMTEASSMSSPLKGQLYTEDKESSNSTSQHIQSQCGKSVGNNKCGKSSLSSATIPVTLTVHKRESTTFEELEENGDTSLSLEVTSKDGSESLFSDVTNNMDDISSFSTDSDSYAEKDLEKTICDFDDSDLDIGSQFDLQFESELDSETKPQTEMTEGDNNQGEATNSRFSEKDSEEDKRMIEKEEGIEGVMDDIFEDDWEEEVMTQYNSQGNASQDTSPSTNVRVVDLDNVTVHSHLLYCCSRYTGRVYLYNHEARSLDSNFLPLDVELGNQDALPDLLLHPENLRLAERFVREWNSLTETKRRLIMKSGIKFTSPMRAYEDLRSGKTHCSQRHITKEDLASRAISKAQEVKGSTRVISRPQTKGQSSVRGEGCSTTEAQSEGFVQAVSEDGTPLCLHCCKPYQNKLLGRDTITSTEKAWSMRFCSRTCMDTYWMKTNSQYGRDKLFEAEHGKCQLCGFEAHSFFRQIRDNPDLKQRAELINGSKFCVLTAKQREQMTKHPAAGQFWHADHIRPVWEGGGECDIDNLRTLCVLCHQNVTTEQAKKRAHIRKLGPATGDISMFFKPVTFAKTNKHNKKL